MQPDHDPGIILSQPGLEQIEAYRQSHQTQLLVLLITDLESSTRQQAHLGNVRAAELVQMHRRVFRGVLTEMDGVEVETAGDSFLTVFAAPSEAVLFALRMQRAMRQAQIAEPELPSVRVGIHLGQVVVERHEDGPKAMDLYGLQVSTAARIMDLAMGGQILCSREVFNNARSILRREQLAGLDEVVWKNHGPYVFKGVESEAGSADSYEVCEAGEVGLAPLEKPAGSAKSHPADQGDEVFGWRPGPDAILPGTNWQLERKLGEGGFGEVWLARDKGGRETVFKFCTKKTKLRSLRREYEVFNALVKDGKSPPGIAEVIEARDDRDGEPPYYIRLAYVAGGDLKDWIERSGANASLRMQLDLAQQMAGAVARIHAAGFVHRDIKPSNFLVEPEDDPNRAPTLRLCDFGIGHEVLQEAIKGGASTQDIAGGGGQFTVGSRSFMQAAGTFVFIAPELQMGSASTPGKLSKDALPAADMYSLGVTLYQLFTSSTDRAPGVGLADVNDPILREDIAACLDTDPAKRPTAVEFAERLERHDERTRERERAIQRERSRRLRIALGAVSIVMLVVLAFAAFAVIQWQEAQAQRQQAEAERERAEAQQRLAEEERERAEALATEEALARDDARRQLYHSSILQAQMYLENGQHHHARQSLWRAPVEHSGWEWGYYAALSEPSFAVLENVVPPSFSPDGRHFLTAPGDDTVRVWDAATGLLATVLEGHEDWVNYAQFSPDSRRIITSSGDKTARIWDVDTGEVLHVLEGHADEVSPAGFSPDGTRVLTASGNFWNNTVSNDYTARVWDATTGNALLVLEGHEDGVYHASFSPDGFRILTASWDETARVWDASTGAVLYVLESDEGGKLQASFSPDGTRILTASWAEIARVWDAATGEALLSLDGEENGDDFASFSPNGRRVVDVSEDGLKVRIWDSETGELIHTLEGHEKRILSVSFSPDGRDILATFRDGSVRVWDAATGDSLHVLMGHADEVYSAAFSPDGARILTASVDRTARLWNSDGTDPYHDFGARWFGTGFVVCSPDSIHIASQHTSNSVAIRDVRSGEILRLLEVDLRHFTIGGVTPQAFSPDGSRLLTTQDDHTTALWDIASGNLLYRLEHAPQETVRYAAFGRDGNDIITASFDRVRIWDSASGSILQEFKNDDQSYINKAVITPDGAQVIAIRSDDTLRVWDRETGTFLRTVGRVDESGVGDSAEISPDGTRMVSASVRSGLSAWDIETGTELFDLERNRVELTSVLAFSPDGSKIVAPGDRRGPHIRDAESGALLRVLEGHIVEPFSANFGPDGGRVVTASADGTVRLWDVETGNLMAVFLDEGQMLSAVFTPDGSRIVTFSEYNTARIWSAAPWRLEDLPPVEGVFETPEAEREARFYEWKRQEYQKWLEEDSGVQTRPAFQVVGDILDALESTGGDSHE